MLHSYDFSWTLQACQVAKHISCLHHLILLITGKSTLQHSTKYLTSWHAVSYNSPSRLFWSFQASAALSRSLILWKVGIVSLLFHSLILAIADGNKFASPPLSQSTLTLDRSLSIMVIYVNETLWLKKKLSVSPLHIQILNLNSGFRICSKCQQKEHAALRRHETLNLVATRFFGKRIFKRDSSGSECLPISQAKKELHKFCKEKCTSHWSSLSPSLPSIRTHARNVKCSCSRGPDFHVPLNSPCLSSPSASCSHKSWALRTWDWLGFHIPSASLFSLFIYLGSVLLRSTSDDDLFFLCT